MGLPGIILTDITDAMSSLFMYDKKYPLIFSTSHFWILFVFVLIAAHYLRDKIFYRNLFLVTFSLFFYFKSCEIYVILLVISTFTDYYLGKAIYRTDKISRKHLYIVLSLIVNLGLLAYFKYSFFIIEQVNAVFGTSYETVDYFAMWYNDLFNGTMTIDELIPPVGISFYTFQTISYSIDIYRGRIKPVHNVLDFAFYVSYFPQLVAGPIVRANEFVPQIYEKYSLTKDEYGKALALILGGLIKKLLFADFIAVTLVDQVFQAPGSFTGTQNVLAAYGYGLQIYGDFSGYSDMAIGLALLMGFKLSINFDHPYRSFSITEFWRRWHISLSTWLKDYLYIPLGGNRGSSIFAHIAIPLISLILISRQADFLSVLLFGLALKFWLLHLILKHWFELKVKIWVYSNFIAFLLTAGLSVHLGVAQDWWAFGFLSLVTICWLVLIIKSELRNEISTYVNLFLTMLIGGIWHGASLNFIIWGILHGGALALNKLWSTIFKTDKKAHWAFDTFSWILTFHFVMLCWIFFRMKTYEGVETMLTQITTFDKGEVVSSVLSTLWIPIAILILGYATHFMPDKIKWNLQQNFVRFPDPVKAFLIAFTIIVLYQFNTGIQAFIYFNF